MLKKKELTLDDIKRMKEYQFISNIPAHHSIVSTLETVLDSTRHKFYIVMEKMDMSLYQLMVSRGTRPFSLDNIRLMLHQITTGLNHIHNNGYFHRDIKPENILVVKVPTPPHTLLESPKVKGSTSHLSESLNDILKHDKSKHPKDLTSYILKLTDFGLARETKAAETFTYYVSTRWYRAPEILLRAGSYGPPADMWALATMGVEISTLKALFPGKDELDQFHLLLEGLGSPSSRTMSGRWSSFKTLTKDFEIHSTKPQIVLEDVVSGNHYGLASLLGPCLKWDPASRTTSRDLLEDPFFHGCDSAVAKLISIRFPSESVRQTSAIPPYKQIADRLLGKSKSVPLQKSQRKTKQPDSKPQDLFVTGKVSTEKPQASFPAISVKFSSSPLKMPPMFSSGPDSWNSPKRTREEKSDISNFYDSQTGISFRELSPIFLSDMTDSDKLSPTLLNHNSADYDEFLFNKSGKRKCSTPDSFHTAKTHFSAFSTPDARVAMAGAGPLTNIDNALRRVENVINSTSASCLKSSGEREVLKRSVEDMFANKEANDLAVMRLTKVLDSET